MKTYVLRILAKGGTLGDKAIPFVECLANPSTIEVHRAIKRFKKAHSTHRIVEVRLISHIEEEKKLKHWNTSGVPSSMLIHMGDAD